MTLLLSSTFLLLKLAGWVGLFMLLLNSILILFQRHHHRPDIVLKVTSAIVEDYTCLVPASLPFLEMLASHSPLMACQLMIALINLYPVVTDIKQKGQTDTEPEKIADILRHHH